jgi:nicotinate phosphoribosyltransferase
MKIVLSGNLDEYKIERLVKKQAPADIFGVGTEMVTSGDAPSLNSAYKLVSVGAGGRKKPVLKLSPFKESYAGPKQIFRRYDRRGKMAGDFIACAEEKMPAPYRPLLKKVMYSGKRIGRRPDLRQIRKRALQEMALLPEQYKSLTRRYSYPVKISPGLSKRTQKVIRGIKHG